MTKTLADVLVEPRGQPGGWLFLPKDEEWELGVAALVKEMEEVPPGDEGEEEAGYPQQARTANLMAALRLVDVEDVVANARAQKPDASEAELLEAFLYYYDNDAFITFE